MCLDGGVDEAGQQVRRDCACPGTDAGFVHLSCLTNYATAKNKGWDGHNISINDTDQLIKPVCPNCHKMYQNELAIDIANEYVSVAYNT